mgnify:CR=1 FL=1
MVRRVRLLLGVVIVAVGTLGAAWARGGEGETPASAPPVALDEPRLPSSGPLARLGRGLANIVLSPLEIPATMLRVGGERNAFFGLWAGGLEGLGNGLVRLSAGVLEAVTFPVPAPPDSLPLYNKRLGARALPPLRPPEGITRP